MASADQRARSRKIRDISRDIDHRSNSIASSTGSNHGTITGTVTMDLLSNSGFSDFDPNDPDIINSTGRFNYSPPTAQVKIPELRDTAKKWGKWSPRREKTPLINTSMLDQAFKDFSCTAPGSNSNNTFSLELPRGPTRNRFRPSPTPVVDDFSFLGRSFKKAADEDKENAPRLKTQDIQKSLKTSNTSPYISHASRTPNGGRRTLAELQAQVTDGSENSLLLPERPATVTLQSTTGRFTQPLSNTSAPISREILPVQASLKQNIYEQTQAQRRKASAATTQDQGRHVSASAAPITIQPKTSLSSELAVPKQRRPVATSYPEQIRRGSIGLNGDATSQFAPMPSPIATSAPAPVSSAAPVHLTNTFVPGHSQVYKTSPTELLKHVRRRSQPDSSYLFTPTHAPPPANAENRTRANSNPTLPTQTFVIPVECAEKTKPFDPRVPVGVQNGKVEAPPARRRRKEVDGIPIPEDDEELYRMIHELHSIIAKLEGKDEKWAIDFARCQQDNAILVKDLRAESNELSSVMVEYQHEIQKLYNKARLHDQQILAHQEQESIFKQQIQCHQQQDLLLQKQIQRQEQQLRSKEQEIEQLKIQLQLARGQLKSMPQVDVKHLSPYARNNMSRAAIRAPEEYQFEDTENFTRNTNMELDASTPIPPKGLTATGFKEQSTPVAEEYCLPALKETPLQAADEYALHATKDRSTRGAEDNSLNLTKDHSIRGAEDFSLKLTQDRSPQRGEDFSLNLTMGRSARGADPYSLNATKDHSPRGSEEYSLSATKATPLRTSDEYALYATKEFSARGADEYAPHATKEQPKINNEAKQHPVLSSNARQVIDDLCPHNCNSCTVCARVASYNKPTGKRTKKTVRTEKPIAISKRNLPLEEDHTLRPARAPGIALAIVVKGIQDEIVHLKKRHAEAVALYHRTDGGMKRKERNMIREEMEGLARMLEVKNDQVYELYDVLEGQEAAGQAMDQSAVDVTVVAAEDDTLHWEQVLEED